MKESETREIIAMARGATTQWPVDDDTVTFWMHSLRSLDAETATKAVMLGARSWDRFPPWASFFEAYRAVQRQEQARERDERDIETGRRGYATPEWVWVWQWARTMRDPRNWGDFPQQDGDPTKQMTTAEYEALKNEWREAGSPKGKIPLVGSSV